MLPILKKNKITNMFKKVNMLLSIINEVIILDDDTIGITLNKNIAIYNDKNIINITKGYNVILANQLHLNPEISLSEFYKNPDNIQKQVDDSLKQLEE